MLEVVGVVWRRNGDIPGYITGAPSEPGGRAPTGTGGASRRRAATATVGIGPPALALAILDECKGR